MAGLRCIDTTLHRNYHLLKLLGEARQDFVPVTGDEYVVFNADTAPTRNIHPRFDGNDHPRLERRGVLARHPRRLVNFQTEPVPDAVVEAAMQNRLPQSRCGRPHPLP